jgi:hypothetical protein
LAESLAQQPAATLQLQNNPAATLRAETRIVLADITVTDRHANGLPQTLPRIQIP